MNEKLKDILTTLYNEPEKLHASCVENLVNKSLPNVNFGATCSTLGMLADIGSYSVVDFAEFIKRRHLSNIENYHDEINKNISSFSEKLSNATDYKSFYKAILNLAEDRSLEKSFFINNLKTILDKEENLKDLYSPIISALILSNLEEKDLNNYGKIDKFSTLIIIALVNAGENRNIPQNIEELRNRSLNIIQTVFPEKEEEAKTLLNSYIISSALTENTNSFVAVRCKAKYTEDVNYDDDVMMYYENCQPKSLISLDTEIDKKTNIIDALKDKDLMQNSNVIKFAL